MQISWTDEQKEVIQASSDSRILVNAGPGTGKTAVACARIAHLIDTLAVDPVHIWLVSFTRTAVHELRHRISDYLVDKRQAYGIRIATIDSHAWAIHSGFSADASLSGSYEENIEKVMGMVRENEGVFEYLSDVQHLFVDEAQDVVGSRCLLMLEIIHALPKDAGVTVLADEAQSIYGFSEEQDGQSCGMTLPEAIREYDDSFSDFTKSELLEIHRTSDNVLRKIFSDGRRIVTKGIAKGDCLTQIRQFVSESNHGSVGHFRGDIKHLDEPNPNMFLLFRKRGEALEASSYLENTPHRIRMSGLPTIIEPWVAQIFWDWDQTRMDAAEFERRWAARLEFESQCPEEAWKALVRFFGVSNHQISVEKLCSRMGGGAPPYDFCKADFGIDGPVVGTIHGVKGREADIVRLYLPRMWADFDNKVEDSEEARVVFVAATRARFELMVGQGATRSYPATLKNGSGRAYTKRNYGGDGTASVEIGRQGDIDAVGLAGQQLFDDCDHVEWAQEEIFKLRGEIYQDAFAVLGGPANDFRYSFHLEEGRDPVCFFSKQVNNDLFKIATEVDKEKPPWKISHQRVFGVRTHVISPDDPVREILYPPWRESGFMLAPLVLGYSKLFFRN